MTGWDRRAFGWIWIKFRCGAAIMWRFANWWKISDAIFISKGPRSRSASGRCSWWFQFLTWEKDSFGYAESYDGRVGRYRGLPAGNEFHRRRRPTGIAWKVRDRTKQLDTETKTEPPPPPVDDPKIIPQDKDKDGNANTAGSN